MSVMDIVAFNGAKLSNALHKTTLNQSQFITIMSEKIL